MIAIAAGHSGDARYALTVLLAVGMGVQNATVRALVVPDLTATVPTLTLTGLAPDSTLAGGANPRPGRGTVLILVGGSFGALLVLQIGMPVALGAVLVLISAAIAGSSRLDISSVDEPQPRPTS